jgi:Zn-dependent peptidase ImmA (M78 family)
LKAECPALALDRMTIEEVGANPERLAQAIHQQLGPRDGAVPIVAIASALDIVEIRTETLRSLEGALQMTPGRDVGSVLLNAASSRQRRRFTLAHELGHFLNALHEPVPGNQFRCSRWDMIAEIDSRELGDRHNRQEAEANRFAAELLMPADRLQPYLVKPASLDTGLAIADALDVSKAAALRRYVQLHDRPQAVLFARNGRLMYQVRHAAFPRLCLTKDAQLPSGGNGDKIAAGETVDWLAQPSSQSLQLQRLSQSDGYETLLIQTEGLLGSGYEADDDEPVEDLVDRFDRWGTRS